MHGDNTVQHLIFGIGLITVPKQDQKNAISAAKANIVGMKINNYPVTSISIGYTSDFIISIPDSTKDARLEIYDQPGGELIINTTNAEPDNTQK